MEKMTKRLPLNLDEKLLESIDQHRQSLESRSGLRVSRSNAAVSLIRTALATSNNALANTAPAN